MTPVSAKHAPACGAEECAGWWWREAVGFLAGVVLLIHGSISQSNVFCSDVLNGPRPIKRAALPRLRPLVSEESMSVA